MTTQQLANEFMENYVKKRLRPTTVRGYQTNLNSHALPLLGNRTLHDLTPDDLDDLTEALQDKGLSNKSIIYVHATLRKALNYALKRGYITNNVYDRFDLPRIEEYTYRTLTEEQITQMLSNANTKAPLHLAIRLALRYGMRRGEVLGIRPETDLDHQRHILHVQRTRTIENGTETVTPCKTKHSNRYILLTEEDTRALRSKKNGYAVPLTPTQLDKQFKTFLRIGGFPNIRFHDLRHSYATLMLSKQVNPKIVSAVLGHSGIAITLNIYSHPDTSMQKVCLEVFNNEKER